MFYVNQEGFVYNPPQVIEHHSPHLHSPALQQDDAPYPTYTNEYIASSQEQNIHQQHHHPIIEQKEFKQVTHR